MSLGKILGGTIGTIIAPGIGTAIGAGLGGIADEYGGQLLANTIARSNANAAYNQSTAASAVAYQRTKALYKNRYQWTMQDMKSAGLNPILAASSGFNVGSSPSVQPAQAFQANVHNLSSSSTAKNYAETDKIVQETQKTIQETKESLERTRKIRAEKGLVTAQERQIHKNISKILAEIRLLANQENLTKGQAEVAWKHAQKLEHLNKRLEQIDKMYDNPLGSVLTFIERIFGSFSGKGVQ